tara:strand:- start:2 stop:244 length:243 start_codon:yes stop_codon:yes gene_type:complete
MIEYAIGPVLALLISMKFTDFKAKEGCKECKKDHENYEARLELVENKVDVIDREVPKKLVVTIAPVAKAVQELQEAIGVK